MGIADKLLEEGREGRHRPGPQPGMIQLLDALPEEDKHALETMIVDQNWSANMINQTLMEEAEELLERAAEEPDPEEAKRLKDLAKLHDISAYTIGRFRRQVRAGKLGVI